MQKVHRPFFALGLLAAFLTGCQITEDTIVAHDAIDGALVDDALAALVEDNSLVGASALIYRNDQEIYRATVGMADREANQVWRRDTLVTLYSMTKPITGVTLMSLYEDGLFELEDELADYLPEYADTQVLAGIDADGNAILEPPRRPIKVIDIFRQTACFGYGWEDHPAAQFMNAANVLNPSKPLSQFSEELAKVPLYCHPGEQWKYGVAVDVQARLAEVVTGQPFEVIVHQRVLDPLKMTDTSYFVSPEDKPRLAAVYNTASEGVPRRVPNSEVYGFAPEKPIQINGGHGLVSSIDDYMLFARMLQNDGTLDGVTVLKPETVALMSRDHLPDGLAERDFLPSKGQVGFGLDFAVRTAAPLNDDEPFGIVGEYFWDGAASPLFWVDPENNITVVFLTQVLPFNLELQAKFRRAVYNALGIDN